MEHCSSKLSLPRAESNGTEWQQLLPDSTQTSFLKFHAAAKAFFCQVAVSSFWVNLTAFFVPRAFSNSGECREGILSFSFQKQKSSKLVVRTVGCRSQLLCFCVFEGERGRFNKNIQVRFCFCLTEGCPFRNRLTRVFRLEDSLHQKYKMNFKINMYFSEMN